MASNTFITAMNSTNLMTTGVNGADVYTAPPGQDQELLALFGALCRDLDAEKLRRMLAAIPRTSIRDLVVLIFNTRDILEGKGERQLFYTMFLWIYDKWPNKIIDLVALIPQYGSWLDLQKIATLARDPDNGQIAPLRAALIDRIVATYCDQLRKDSSAESSWTLAAKWAPREGKQFDWLAAKLAAHLHPQIYAKSPRTARCIYRKLVARINANLETVERNMCHDADHRHHFADIAPGRVPAKCLKLKRRAFFNELSAKEVAKRARLDGAVASSPSRAPQFAPGSSASNQSLADGTDTATAMLRHPVDEDRMTCRSNFEAHIAAALAAKTSPDDPDAAKVHGRRIMPHEFIVDILKGGLTTNDRNTLQAQWNDLRDGLLERGTLGKTVVMCDFSGSMGQFGQAAKSGTVNPINVSAGLGLLCAETTCPAFRDFMLTFDSTPTWHNLAAFGPDLLQRVDSFRGVSQGTSTNFEAAVRLILNRLVACHVPAGDEPDVLLVLTDMGWDMASNKHSNRGAAFETHIDRIKRKFAAAGNWKCPTIVIWNLSGKFQQYHHAAATPGVCTVSGWSPAILKFLMDNGGGGLPQKLLTMTPVSLMREVLDDARYDAVRSVLDA